MTKFETFIWIIGSALLSFVYACTSPIVHLYFVKLITPDILAMANVISVGLAALVNSSVPIARMMELYRKYFTWIVVVDVICFCLISFESVAHPNVRFIGFAILNAVSTTLWCVVMRNMVDRILNGDSRTKFDAFNNSVMLYASLAGGVVAYFFTDIPVGWCIGAQCFANMFMGTTDLIAVKVLKPKVFKEAA